MAPFSSIVTQGHTSRFPVPCAHFDVPVSTIAHASNTVGAGLVVRWDRGWEGGPYITRLAQGNMRGTLARHRETDHVSQGIMDTDQGSCNIPKGLGFLDLYGQRVRDLGVLKPGEHTLNRC